MSTRVVDQVDSWDDRSFSGGYRELQDLADSEFSGVVRAGGAELYMTRGVIVGINRGDIEDFESGGTTYQAPTDALPLLAIMQDRTDEVRAKYYSEETGISKVDKTLSDGGFTGFIELSENVLSGDYYLVYHAGTSMSVAYVGESGRLIEGDEAFETADDEVGIYEVRPVDIDPIEIPEPEDDEEPTSSESTDSAAGAAGTAGDEGAAEPTADSEPTTDDSTDNGVAPAQESEAIDALNDSPAQPESDGTAQQHPSAQEEDQPVTSAAETGGQAATDEQGDSDRPAQRAGDHSETRETADRSQQSSTDSATESSGSTEPDPREHRDRQTGAKNGRTRERTTQTDAADAGASKPNRTRKPESNGRPQSPQEPTRSKRRAQTASGRSQRANSSVGDVETKAIPSLNPDQTAVPDAAEESSDPIPSPTGGAQSEDRPPEGRGHPEPAPEPTEPAQSTPSDPQPAQSPPQTARVEQRGEPAERPPAEPDEPDPQPVESEPAVDSEHLGELEDELAEKDEHIDDLEAELDSVTEERDDLETERNDLEAELKDLQSERDELQEEVEKLRGELRRLEEDLGAATDAERRLSAEEALSGTDIFVRYRSKGEATLEKAHGASTRKEDVNENLRLEKHTQFDADTVAVGGQSYGEFLESTLEYQFVRWVVRELLFEIRDTGHEKALSDLYNVLPQIDRAELAGVVEVTYTEDGQETQSQESFDVVLRNRMGNPLLAANLNDSREATTESMMERLITSAERVGQSSDGFSGAFLVTESFFDPGALEVASDATQGGLLSRDKRKSFVNLSRKRGYHLCLVEARNENFHLAVPEL